jgi:hypothetical protein
MLDLIMTRMVVEDAAMSAEEDAAVGAVVAEQADAVVAGQADAVVAGQAGAVVAGQAGAVVTGQAGAVVTGQAGAVVTGQAANAVAAMGAAVVAAVVAAVFLQALDEGILAVNSDTEYRTGALLVVAVQCAVGLTSATCRRMSVELELEVCACCEPSAASMISELWHWAWQMRTWSPTMHIMVPHSRSIT